MDQAFAAPDETGDDLDDFGDLGDSGLRTKNYILSPNDIDRNEVCPAARVYTGPRPKPHPAMWHGIFIHRFLEYSLTRGKTAALAYIKSKRNKGVINVCSKINTDLIPQHAVPELKIMVDTQARSAECSEREFADPDKHILGTADIVYRNDGDEVEWNVDDYKSGDQHGVVPEGNTQLLTLAVGVALMQDVDRVNASIVDVVKTGALVWHRTTYTEKMLRKHYARMRRVHLMTLETRAECAEEGAEPDVIPGPHCRGCRATSVCVGGVLMR